MNTDKFDEAFRRKVESFHPPFSENEVDRIQGYITQHLPLSFWQRFGHVFTYSVSTLLIVSLLTTTLYQLNENKILLNKINELNTKLEQKQLLSTTAIPLKKKVIVEKIDTVYVLKHIRKDVLLNDPQEINFSEDNLSETKSNPISEVENNNDNSFESIEATNGSKSNKNENRKVGIFVKTPKKTIVKRNINYEKESAQEISNQGEYTPKNSNVTDNAITLDKQVEISKQINLNEVRSKGFLPLSLSSATLLREPILKSYDTKALVKNKEFKLPSIKLPPLKYRIGIGANMDNQQIGTSILAEFLLRKKWSVSTGASVNFLGFEHFGNEDEFKRKTTKDFREEHKVDFPVGVPIENIEARQILFRIPLYLNYRIALRNDFTFTLGGGTDFDLHLQKLTSFSRHNYDDSPSAFSEKIKVTAFNNLMFSTGIEKRWKKFSLQISPYAAYQFKTLTYKPTDWTFGIKLNSFYRVK
ncbi:hypothetical protein Emtol_3562 [Emticicia oligotrophica DSM 17448]|uniref:Outer membrane protein beta-barrel domain-containing protein n=1 Tax=Emticicia oligotrophica (strain DSM 17448 / CIP 109782 / MTCC 6937 / GPTSA100-15) TaxID=929562 RepID=A0ABM5N5D0_EMTOG|nr:hypothetical protein [Emticicia oligotrophica]AFK04688.1 hypothetical protein Emtol_3562 [Emticicia oligotrophica DSM 17448]